MRTKGRQPILWPQNLDSVLSWSKMESLLSIPQLLVPGTGGKMSPSIHRGSTAQGRSHGQNLDRGGGLEDVSGGEGWARKGRMGVLGRRESMGEKGTQRFSKGECRQVVVSG